MTLKTLIPRVRSSASPAESSSLFQIAHKLQEYLDGFELSAVMPWLTFAGISLWLKFNLLRMCGFRQSALSLGRARGGLSLFEGMSLFRADFLMMMCIVPGLLLLVMRMFKFRRQVVIVGVAAMTIELMLFAQVRGFYLTGRFISAETLLVAVQWLKSAHSGAAEAMPGLALLKMIGGTAAIGATSWLAQRFSSRRGFVKFARAGAVAAYGLGALIVMAGMVHPADPMTWNRDLLTTTLSAYTTSDGISAVDSRLRATLAASGFENLSNESVLATYRRENATPAVDDSRFKGVAAGYNVLMFVMETAPARIMDPSSDDLAQFPNIALLKKHSLVGAKHYTSFPATNRAIFAMFSSMYTNIAVGRLLKPTALPHLPGLMSDLAQAGYDTSYYGQVWRDDKDEQMLRALGFNRIVQSKSTDVIEQDTDNLKTMLQDIHGQSIHHRRWAKAYFPLVGHSPWRDLTNKQGSDMDAKGKAIEALEDKWLAQIIEQLSRDHVLDHTIILVTGDHGIRMRSEHPEYSARTNDITYRVPLLIYAPKVFKTTVKIEVPTSHIDISPTLLTMLGISKGRDWEIGVPVWNKGLAKRRLFFLDLSFYEGGKYFAYEINAKAAYTSGELLFKDTDLIVDGGRRQQIWNTIERQGVLQDVLLQRYLAAGSTSAPKN